MKKILLFAGLFWFGCNLFAQTIPYDTIAPYLKVKTIPNFSLQLPAGELLTQQNIIENKCTIIMLFNPECEHCQKLTQQLVKIAGVKKSQLIMVTTEPWEKIKKFEQQFKLKNFGFVKIARDEKYFFGVFYKPTTIPVLAFYNTAKQFIALKQGNITTQEIKDILK
jgi:thiol-disulfide isomerase/thioredoxin